MDSFKPMFTQRALIKLSGSQNKTKRQEGRKRTCREEGVLTRTRREMRGNVG